jgi:YgiT-type zinc finger domain-containing protein
MCPICKKGALQHVNDILYDFGSERLLISGERCTQCKEELFDETQYERIHAVRKRLDVWGEDLLSHLTLRRKIGRSGRQLTVRIPVDIERALKLKGGEDVSFSLDGKRRIVLAIGK